MWYTLFMRVEPYSVGSVVHVMKRGARDMEIVRDESDRWRFARSLYILNDEYQDPHRDNRNHLGKSDLPKSKSLFFRPETWPEQKPLVAILGWALMLNHTHLLLQEITKGGVSKFMQRLCGSITLSFNEKYDGKGSIFQGAFKSRTVDTNEYLQYVHAYIVVKNTFENYPGGLETALVNFEHAWEWVGKKYTFSSFSTASQGFESPIINIQAFHNLGLARKDFKQFAKNMLETHISGRDDLNGLILEDW